MKIYISEKDFDTCGEKIETFNDVDLGLFDSVWNAYDIIETIERGAIITPLEKHDAEIKAPLLEEIEKLKTENYHLKQALEFGKSSYASLQEQLQLVKRSLVPATLLEDGYVLHYLSSDRIRKQAKQEVINELLEWSSKELSLYTVPNKDYEYPDNILFSHYKVFTDDLKQKLNEMKGGSNE